MGIGSSTTMSDRAHLSIGEVLSLLQDEFPDITISKIRFLESQGLLDPERTPSGYRKFYENDIDRLRWILVQQRENFLPLKVIKDRLASGELDDPTPTPDAASGTTTVEIQETVVAVDETLTLPLGAPVAAPAPTPGPPSVLLASASQAEQRRSRDQVAAGPAAPTPAAPAPAAPTSAPVAPAAPPAAAVRSDGSGSSSSLDTGESAVSLTLDDLVRASGLTSRQIGELERYGLLASRSLGNTTYYDEDALIIARLSRSFLGHGVEPRHIRMYKVAAEREAGVFEQLVVPSLKKRNPAARQEALELLDELSGLGEQLRGAMLRQALREYLGPA